MNKLMSIIEIIAIMTFFSLSGYSIYESYYERDLRNDSEYIHIWSLIVTTSIYTLIFGSIACLIERCTNTKYGRILLFPLVISLGMFIMMFFDNSYFDWGTFKDTYDILARISYTWVLMISISIIVSITGFFVRYCQREDNYNYVSKE